MMKELDLERLTTEEKEKLRVLLDKLINPQTHGLVRKREVWLPEIGETYWTICADSSATNGVKWCTYEGDTIDRMRYLAGLIFKTKEEAEFALEKMKVKRELDQYAYEYNDLEKEAWTPGNYHYLLTYSYLTHDLTITEYGMEREESVTYFTSEEVAKGAIEKVGKEKIIRYLFGIEQEENINK